MDGDRMSFKQYGEKFTEPRREVLAEAPTFVSTPTWQASATDPDLLTRELPDGCVWETPEWGDLATEHIWPDQTLLADDGKIWRNVSGVPLTTRPSEFPGDPKAWARLFEEVRTDPDQPAEPNEPGIPEWVQPLPGIHFGYSLDDMVLYDGKIWKSTVAGKQTNMWKPGEYGWILVDE